jgi:AP-5 complex subunit beta-1
MKERQSLAFDSFVELLFDIISNVNSSPDRVLRGCACQCLQELEETYPGNIIHLVILTFKGLLCSGLGHLFSFAQRENTHVAMEYTTLFELVLLHHLMVICGKIS